MIRTFIVNCAVSTAQVLPENIIGITSAELASTSSTAVGQYTSLTPVTGSPSATQIQFTGTIAAPSAAVTLNAAAVTGQELIVRGTRAAGNLTGY